MPKITFDVLCEPDRPGVPDEDLAIDRLGAAQVRPVRLGNPNHCANHRRGPHFLRPVYPKKTDHSARCGSYEGGSPLLTGFRVWHLRLTWHVLSLRPDFPLPLRVAHARCSGRMSARKQAPNLKTP